MSVVEIAKSLYERKGEGNFEEDVLLYAKEHYIFSSPSCIIMARCEETRWFIHLAVGDGCLSYFLHIMPVWKPFVAWCRGLRNDRVKHYQTDKLIKLLL